MGQYEHLNFFSKWARDFADVEGWDGRPGNVPHILAELFSGPLLLGSPLQRR